MTKARDLSAFVSQGVSTTELGYLDGVTSAVQTQLNQKAEFTAGKNRAINGDFAINQRAFTTTSSDNIFFADRWLTTMFSGTVTFANTSIAYNSFPGQVSNRALRITSSSSTNDAGIRHKIEDVTTFAGQTITISCWIRSSGTTYNIDLVEALQVFAGSANVYTYADVSGKTYNNNWTRLSFQVAIPSAAGKTIGSGNHLSIRIDPANGIANGDWIEITHLQIEAGSVATPFTLAGGGHQQAELALCQRYYWRDTGFQSSGGVQSAFDNNVWFSLQNFNPVPMRTTPTAAIESSPYIADFQANLRTITSVNVVSKYAVGFAYSSTKLTSNLAFGLNFSDAGRALSFSSEL